MVLDVPQIDLRGEVLIQVLGDELDQIVPGDYELHEVLCCDDGLALLVFVCALDDSPSYVVVEVGGFGVLLHEEVLIHEFVDLEIEGYRSSLALKY